MPEIYICQSQGLGDFIVCNALIRAICTKFDKCYLFVMHTHIDSVIFMYRDIKNLECISTLNEYNMMLTVHQKKLPHIMIGMQTFDRSSRVYDFSFYYKMGVDFSKRWEGFKVIRDLPSEEQFYKKIKIKYNLDDSEYAFVHEDVARNMIVDKKLISIPKIVFSEKGLTPNIFDYLTIIERAKEIHVIPSSFSPLIDSLDIGNKLYLHKYSRNIEPFAQPTLKRNWIIYN